MAEFDFGLIQSSDCREDAAEFFGEALAETILIDRTDDDDAFEACILRLVTAAEARGDGALSITPEAVEEDAVGIAGISESAKGALDLTTATDEARGADHFDEAAGIEEIGLGRAEAENLALRRTQGRDERGRMLRAEVEAQ